MFRRTSTQRSRVLCRNQLISMKTRAQSGLSSCPGCPGRCPTTLLPCLYRLFWITSFVDGHLHPLLLRLRGFFFLVVKSLAALPSCPCHSETHSMSPSLVSVSSGAVMPRVPGRLTRRFPLQAQANVLASGLPAQILLPTLCPPFLCFSFQGPELQASECRQHPQRQHAPGTQ